MSDSVVFDKVLFFSCRVEKEKAQAVEQQAKVSEQPVAEDFEAPEEQ
jgi:hypothetical protein